MEQVLIKDGGYWHTRGQTNISATEHTRIFVDEGGLMTHFNNYQPTRKIQYLELNPLILIAQATDYVAKYPCYSLGGKISNEYFDAKPKICVFGQETALNPDYFHWLGDENLPLGLLPLKNRYEIIEVKYIF